MAIHQDEDFLWADSPDDFKPDYHPIKVRSILQFYKLKGKTSKICLDNVEGMRYLYYLLFSPQEKRYYKRFWKYAPLDVYYFYRRTLEFSGEDLAVENLRRYVEDGNITLLLTKPQVIEVSEMLLRVGKAYLKRDVKINYYPFIELMRLELDYEDYKDTGKSLTGYKTVCNQFEQKINELVKKEIDSIKA